MYDFKAPLLSFVRKEEGGERTEGQCIFAFLHLLAGLYEDLLKFVIYLVFQYFSFLV